MTFTYQNTKEFEELLAIYKGLPQRQAVLEIGSLLGDTLHEWIKYADPGAMIISIDLPVPQHDHRYWEQKKGHDYEWRYWANLHQVELVILPFPSQSRTTWETGINNQLLRTMSFDFIFIDGSHGYEDVKQDFYHCINVAKPYCPVALHDINLPESGSKRFWKELKSCFTWTTQEIIYSDMGIGVVW